ncbi:MAG: nicotinate (nicotinamide) nucleotide adenylyltransferase [Candidatus Sericytochromatia bacterium]|nr:nicotinate (nicotinamide) nucleotide adenylyltransferase [Candidatus Sericytochromatia bacterium]
MRYALYGGTFDPFHVGHLAVARAVRDAGLVDAVLLIPAGSPPHRQPTRASAEERWCMALLATLPEPGLRVVRWETERASEGPTYAIDTVRRARGELGAEAELYWVLGADALETLSAWQAFGLLCEWVQFLVLPRAPYDLAWIRSHAARLREAHPAFRLVCLEMPAVAVSSTALREALSAGQVPRDVLPPLVADYLTRYPLYRDPPSPGWAAIPVNGEESRA